MSNIYSRLRNDGAALLAALCGISYLFVFDVMATGDGNLLESGKDKFLCGSLMQAPGAGPVSGNIQNTQQMPEQVLVFKFKEKKSQC